MWQEILDYINNDSIVGGIIAKVISNTLSEPISDGLKKLFKKKHEEKELTVEGCKQTGIKEEDVVPILEEIKRLKNNKVIISQDNEEGKNTNEISGLSNAKGNVEISQNNKKGDNNLNISF